jgi:predicted aldo/keto reductase-like oxidoreductase
MRVSGYGVTFAWVLTFVLSWIGAGRYLGFVVEGNNPALLSKAPLVLPLLALVASLVLTVLWVRRRGGPAADAGEAGRLARRRFLIGGGVAVGGLLGSVVAAVARNLGWYTVTSSALFAETPKIDPNPRAEWGGARVQEYRRLGRTDFRVSDISLGSGRIKPEGGEAVARLAIERGVNYFDTSPDYSEAGSEMTLGKALKGQRDEMFLATKFCTPQGDLPAGSPVSMYMEMVENSLKRLQTDYVDLVHIHACNTVERLMDPNAHEAFDRLKKQGKVRFLGVSSHTPNLELVANTALDSDRFDVLMLAYHHGAWPQLSQIIDRAARQDVGVVAMKTLKGAHHRGLLDFRDESDSYTQAAFKWVLNNPSVSCLVVSFFELGQVDEYLHASGKRPSAEDYAALHKYDELVAGVHCWQHCGACLDSCPEQLAIDDVLRYRMYFEDYGDEKEAMRLYARLDRQADVCVGCSAPCTGSCPHGVPIQERITGAHRLLTLS